MLLSQRKTRIKESWSHQCLSSAHALNCIHTVRAVNETKTKLWTIVVSGSMVCLLLLCMCVFHWVLLNQPIVYFVPQWGSGHTAACEFLVSLYLLLHSTSKLGSIKQPGYWSPGKGQLLSKQFLFDTACSKNSMQCRGDFNMNVFPIQTLKDKWCLWCDAWVSVRECGQCLTQVGFSLLNTVYFLSVRVLSIAVLSNAFAC